MRKNEPIHLIGVDVQNFRRIRFARVRLDDQAGLVRVTGKNASGKTSLLQAIAATLGGARAFNGESAIHDDANGEESFTKVLLSNGFTIERRYSPDAPKGKLTIVSSDGLKANQSKLDEWLGKRSTDPLTFFDLDDAKRADVLLSLAKDPDLPAKLNDLRIRRQAYYDDRTPHIVQARAAKAVPRPAGTQPEPVDVATEMKRLAALRDDQKRIDEAARAVLTSKQAVARALQKVLKLEEELAAARKALEEENENFTSAQEELESLPPDRTAAIEAVETYIRDASVVDKQLEPWRAWEKAQSDLTHHTAEAEALSAQIGACDAWRTRLLAESGIPVDGLTFDEEGTPLINGRPFSVASGAERIRTAVAVALAAQPQLRIVLLDEANDLDLDSLRALDELAKEKNFAIWACRLGIESAGEVVVDDGVATSNVVGAAAVEDPRALPYAGESVRMGDGD